MTLQTVRARAASSSGVSTWIDGRQETCRRHDIIVCENILWLNWDRYPRSNEPFRRIPLANVRIWTADDP